MKAGRSDLGVAVTRAAGSGTVSPRLPRLCPHSGAWTAGRGSVLWWTAEPAGSGEGVNSD